MKKKNFFSISPIYSKTIVFSGKFNSFKKAEAEATALHLGAKVSKDVTKRTQIMVCGSGSGLKLEKAKKYGVEIISEEDWLILININ